MTRPASCQPPGYFRVCKNTLWDLPQQFVLLGVEKVLLEQKPIQWFEVSIWEEDVHVQHRYELIYHVNSCIALFLPLCNVCGAARIQLSQCLIIKTLQICNLKFVITCRFLFPWTRWLIMRRIRLWLIRTLIWRCGIRPPITTDKLSVETNSKMKHCVVIWELRRFSLKCYFEI